MSRSIYISTHIYTYLRLAGQVDGSAKLGEGYNIVSGRDCARYCALIPECRHWTWYKHHCRANKWAVQTWRPCFTMLGMESNTISTSWNMFKSQNFVHLFMIICQYFGQEHK